jgi:hypothetical protein
LAQGIPEGALEGIMGPSTLYQIDLKAGSIKEIGEGNSPSLSSNRDLIAFFTRGPGGTIDHNYWSLEIADINGSNRRTVYQFESTRYLWTPSPAAWSPDGKYLAFPIMYSGNVDNVFDDKKDKTAIWVVSIDGSYASNLTEGLEGNLKSPEWSP